MGPSAFIDTGGFFSVLSTDDVWHSLAVQRLREAEELHVNFVTTDYVLDETFSLLRARGYGHRIQALIATLNRSSCRIVWMNPIRFGAAEAMFTRYDDKQWSFTDCVSFCVMQELGISEALASDRHFVQAGFQVLLSE